MATVHFTEVSGKTISIARDISEKKIRYRWSEKHICRRTGRSPTAREMVIHVDPDSFLPIIDSVKESRTITE
ncbi:MAG: hypothetical protein ACYCSO_02905 [Cuniculiplasma sp.]